MYEVAVWFFFCGEIDQKGSNFQSTIFEPLDSMLDYWVRLLVGWFVRFKISLVFTFLQHLKLCPKACLIEEPNI